MYARTYTITLLTMWIISASCTFYQNKTGLSAIQDTKILDSGQTYSKERQPRTRGY